MQMNAELTLVADAAKLGSLVRASFGRDEFTRISFIRDVSLSADEPRLSEMFFVMLTPMYIEGALRAYEQMTRSSC